MLSYNQFITEKLTANVDYFPSKTSINQISAGLKMMVTLGISKQGDINLDYGGGRFEKGTQFLSEYGVTNLIYDKYARSEEHNKQVLDKLKQRKADTLTLLNVLNVIESKEERLNIIKHAYSLLENGGTMLITVYEGEGKTGLTKLGTWQENRPLSSYVPEVKEALSVSEVLMRGRCMIIKKDEMNEGFYLKTEKGSVIQRSKYGVGKSIGGSLYFHKDYINDIPIVDKKLIQKLIDQLPKDFKFNIIKYPEKPGENISFINSPDFDTNPEPIITDLYIYKDNKLTYIPERDKKQIYHHKWLFVKDDYNGFDIEESKERSAKWLALPNIDFSRIGYQDYWKQNVVPLIK